MKTATTQLSTKALAELASRVLEVSGESSFTVVENHPYLTALKTEYQKYNQIVHKQAYSGKGADVAKADEVRDKVFSALKNYLKAYLGLSLLPNKEEATAIYEVFQKHGLNLDKQTYAAESTSLENLITELDTEENLQKMERLQIKTSFAELKAKQAEFAQIFNSQMKANAELRTMKSASLSRKDLESALRNYLNMVTALKSLAQWKDLYVRLSEVVKVTK